MYEQHHLCSSINFAMHKIKPGTLTAGMVKNIFKATIKRLLATDNASFATSLSIAAFSFMS